MSRHLSSRFVLGFVVILLTSALQPLSPLPSLAQTDCRTFPETGKSVCGRFLQYWQTHGGLAQQGLPINESNPETSDVDGKVYLVQYFERAVFEMHSENQPPNDVLLSLLGALRYQKKYASGAPNQTIYQDGRLFPQTGHRIGGEFLAYWLSHGGLAQQGYPISDMFIEVSETNGQQYYVQYFERAVFEKHPENQPPNNVLLSQLGRFRFEAKYGTIVGQTIDFAGTWLGRTGTFRGNVLYVTELNVIRPCSPYNGGFTQGKFVLVFMMVTNTGLSSASTGHETLKLRDSAGRTFDIVDDSDVQQAVTLCSGWKDYSENLQPSVPTPIVFIFDAALGSVSYYLVASHSPSSDNLRDARDARKY